MRVLRAACGPTFVIAGALHFIKPKPYEAIMPPYLPAPKTLVYLSGLAEADGGLGLMASDPRVRRWASWWLAATLVAIFPANLQMALHPEQYPQVPGGKWALYARLPLQAAFIAWVLAAGDSDLPLSERPQQ